MTGLLLAVALAWDEVGEDARPTGRSWPVERHFRRGGLPARNELCVDTDPAALGRMAARTAEAIRTCRHPSACTSGAFTELGIAVDDVLATLDLVALTAEEDAGKAHQRLLDPDWIAEHFEVWTWWPDLDGAAGRRIGLEEGQLRLTKYLVYQLEGSPVRTEIHDTALYASPPDGSSTWTRLTRPEIYAGAFEPGGLAEGELTPLVWLTEEGVNQALMQGTVEVRLTDGRARLFNVHHNNGVPWDPSEKDGSLQRRYWTFREVEGILGVEGVPLEPWVAVAGDVYNVGFGKLVALHAPDGHGHQVLRLAVLADTGGAFQPNLFQLDWLAGAYPSHAAYEERVADLPRRVTASILVVR